MKRKETVNNISKSFTALNKIESEEMKKNLNIIKPDAKTRNNLNCINSNIFRSLPLNFKLILFLINKWITIIYNELN